MKVLIYADFRSPHARGWRDGLVASGIDVLAVSSESTQTEGVVGPSGSISVARQKYVDRGRGGDGILRSFARRISAIQAMHSAVQLLRSRSRKRDLMRAIDLFKPDLVHALRLPYEGITALSVRSRCPIVVSSWGLDFEPQASTDALLRFWLRKYLGSAAGFQYDSPIDLLRARGYGLPVGVPTLHAAGNFGIDESLFHASDPKTPGLVVYARKATPNCNYFGFIEAAVSLFATSGATFVGVGLERVHGEAVARFGKFDETRLRLIGELDRKEFSQLIREAHVVVSPSYWDGMPNSVLEAAASGARIVAGDLPQLQSLVDLGVDIDLIDARDSKQIALAIKRQLASRSPLSVAKLPDEYSRIRNIDRIEQFYKAVLSSKGS